MKGWFLEISKLILSLKEGVLMVLGAIGGDGGNRFLVMVAMEEAVFAALTCLLALGFVGCSIVGTIIGSMNHRRTQIKVVIGLITTTQLLESSNIEDNSISVLVALLRSLVIGVVLLELATCEVAKAYQWLINMVETSYEEIRDIYDVLEDKGVPRDIIIQLPEFKFKSMMEPCSTQPSCSICLQDFMDGDSVRRLPNCKHMFHSGCIDEWLRQKRSCPICRLCVCDEPF